MIKFFKGKLLDCLLLIGLGIYIGMALSPSFLLSNDTEKKEEYELNKPGNRQILDDVIKKESRASNISFNPTAYITKENLQTVIEEIEPIKVMVGRFQCPAGAGNHSVTGVGFKPRLVKFFWARASTARIRSGMGHMDYNGNEGSICWASENDTQVNALASNRCIYQRNQADVFVLGATYVSMDSDGYTINIDTADSNFFIYWEAYR